MYTPAVIRDVLGNTFEFRERPHRVVSLVPSVTETLFAIGAGADVVAITDWCIFPGGLTLPRVGGTKNPSIDAIRALQPDLVHMNLEENLERHARAIREFAPVFVSEPKRVADVVALLRTLGEIHDQRERAAELASELRAEIDRQPLGTFTFACPIWKNPWMWCGGDTYVSDLIARAGGRNVLGDFTRYPAIALDDVLRLEPDVVFLPDEPYLFTEADADALRARSIRVTGPFPGHLFTWHGVRTIDGLRWLRESGPADRAQ
jgi:ABC-type Fe3+-hydroxamate transport system substrate-binding protein